MENNFKELAQILLEQGSQIAEIGREISKDEFAVFPLDVVGEKMSYADALIKANRSKNAAVILKVVKVIPESKKGVGIVRHALSKLNGKPVIIGSRNADGLIRVIDAENGKVEYVHEKFIERM